MSAPPPIVNAITVDVEDYFHPSELASAAPQKSWRGLESRVSDSTLRLLDVFGESGVRGTFFILGWVAERHPSLVAEIAKRGHEIACHSFWHRLVYNLTPEEFDRDTREAVQAIQAACGVHPTAYRAPSFSITGRSLWALDRLAAQGFLRDSSISPIVHDRYGIPGFLPRPQQMNTTAGTILEIPVATARLGAGRVAPVGGGGYLRMLPYRYTAAGLRQINLEDRLPACIYMHPWEFDPRQPRMAIGMVARARTYLGLSGMEAKLRNLLRDFRFAPMVEVYPAP